jgi:hypothetical protein
MVDFSRLRAARGQSDDSKIPRLPPAGQNESAPQTQPTRSPQGRFGQQSGPSRGGINLQPRSPRYPRLPAPGDFEVVRIARVGYTNVKGAFAIEFTVEFSSTHPESEKKRYATLIARSNWQDTYVGEFAAATEGIGSDDPAIVAFGQDRYAQVVDDLLRRDFEERPLPRARNLANACHQPRAALRQPKLPGIHRPRPAPAALLRLESQAITAASP